MTENRRITIEGYTVEEIPGIGEAYHYVYDTAEKSFDRHADAHS